MKANRTNQEEDSSQKDEKTENNGSVTEILSTERNETNKHKIGGKTDLEEQKMRNRRQRSKRKIEQMEEEN